MRVIGIIPARGGSKGVPRKNVRLLCGKPLLQYTAESARAARLLHRIVLSTEDDEIADLGKRFGLDVPFMRPAALAQDDTPTLPVVQHVLTRLEEQNERFDAVCLLQPTNPLRRPEDIDACIEMLEQRPLDSVISVLSVPAEYNPHWVFFQDSDGLLRLSTGEMSPIARRQDLPVAFHRDGSVYVTRRNVVMTQNSLFGTRVAGYLMKEAHSLNVDTMKDWERAEQILLGRH